MNRRLVTAGTSSTDTGVAAGDAGDAGATDAATDASGEQRSANDPRCRRLSAEIAAGLHGVSAETLRAQLRPSCADLGNGAPPSADDPPDAADACPDSVEAILREPPPLRFP